MGSGQTFVADPDTGYELTVVDLDPLRAAIHAAGDLDLAARQDLAEVLRDQEDAGRRVVWLDLAQVTFLDCSCLAVLVASHHRFRDLRGLLVLRGVGDNVARILKITGLDDALFVVAADTEQATKVLMARAAVRRRVPRQRRAVAKGLNALTSPEEPPHQRRQSIPGISTVKAPEERAGMVPVAGAVSSQAVR